MRLNVWRSLATWLFVLAVLTGCTGHMPRIVVVDDPLTAEEHLSLGASYESRGEFEAALEQYRLAAEGGQKARAELHNGNVRYRMKEFVVAEKHYRTAIENDSGLADAYNNLAWLLFEERRNLEEAEKLAAKAVHISRERDGKPDPNFEDTLNQIRSARKPQDRLH